MGKASKKLMGLPALVGVLILAAALRFYHLGHESLWIDEGNSIRDASIHTIARASKPLYYAILSVWMKLGESEFVLRSLALIFGLVSVFLIYLIGKELISRRVGVIAALFCAVSPFTVYHSQEVRMYSLLLMLGLATVYFFVRLRSSWNVRLAAAYVAAASLSLLTHPMAVFLIIALNFSYILDWRQTRKHWKTWFVSQALILGIWAPWMPYVIGFGNILNEWQMSGELLTIARAPLFWSWFALGEWNRLIYPDKLPLRYAHFAYAWLFTALMLTGMILRRCYEDSRLLTIWLVVPLVLMLGLSAMWDKTWAGRYLIFTAPAAYLLAAVALSSLRRSFAVAAVICLLILPLFRLDRYYTNTLHAEWRPAVRYLESRVTASDFIGIYKPSNQYVFRHYYRGPAPWAAFGPKDPYGDKANWPAEEAHKAVKALPTDRYSWLVVSRISSDAFRRIEDEIARQGRLIEHEQYFEIDLYLLAPAHSTR